MELCQVALVILLVIVFDVAAYTNNIYSLGLQDGDYCTTVENKTGTCKNIEDCDYMREIYYSNDRMRTPDETEYILESQCGQKGKTPLICCENESTPNGRIDTSLSRIVPEPISDCTTPDGHEGLCISIFECGYLQDIMDGPRPMDFTIRDSILELECASDEKYSVCCRNINPAELLPSTDICGIQKANNKIFGGKETAIDQYPWIVLIEYIKGGKIITMCGGSLISSRYVLTAAHCIKPSILSVRLGDHNITSIVDCQNTNGGVNCSDPFLRVGIERIIIHELYDQSKSIHDISLIRLQKSVEFTDFITPICLPTHDIIETYNVKKKLLFTTAGWGIIFKNGFLKSSVVKMDVKVPYVTIEECIDKYISKKYHPSSSSHICAGGNGKDACRGDSGGPLMHAREDVYEVIGVVSFGPKKCKNRIPGVYTKVFLYRDWILDNLSP